MDYQNKEYDEVVKQESLDKYKSQTNNDAKSVENAPEVIVSQRFSVRITRTVDEKLSRALHGRAGTGSSRPCVCCGMERKDCKNKLNFGTLKITHTSTELLTSV